MRAARKLPAVALIAAGLGHLAYHLGYTLDDAYITFRFSKNLVRGAGLVYNAGDYVKGYSNTLYTLLMAIPELFDTDPIVLSKCIGVLSFTGMAVLGAHWLGTRAHGGAWGAPIVWVWLACIGLSTPIAVHYVNGLETGLHTTLLFAAVVRRLMEQDDARRRPWSALLFVGVVLGRPEGIGLFAAMAVHDLVWRMRTRNLRAIDAVFYGLPVFAYAGELVWSWQYYGDPLPQTASVKMKRTQSVWQVASGLGLSAWRTLVGRSYLGDGLRQLGWGGWTLCFAGLALVDRTQRRRNLGLLCVDQGIVKIDRKAQAPGREAVGMEQNARRCRSAQSPGRPAGQSPDTSEVTDNLSWRSARISEMINHAFPDPLWVGR